MKIKYMGLFIALAAFIYAQEYPHSELRIKIPVDASEALIVECLEKTYQLAGEDAPYVRALVEIQVTDAGLLSLRGTTVQGAVRKGHDIIQRNLWVRMVKAKKAADMKTHAILQEEYNRNEQKLTKLLGPVGVSEPPR